MGRIRGEEREKERERGLGSESRKDTGKQKN